MNRFDHLVSYLESRVLVEEALDIVTFVEAKVCICALVNENITLAYKSLQQSINISKFSSQIGLLYAARPNRKDAVDKFFFYGHEVEVLNRNINPNVIDRSIFSKEIYTQNNNRKD